MTVIRICSSLHFTSFQELSFGSTILSLYTIMETFICFPFYSGIKMIRTQILDYQERNHCTLPRFPIISHSFVLFQCFQGVHLF